MRAPRRAGQRPPGTGLRLRLVALAGLAAVLSAGILVAVAGSAGEAAGASAQTRAQVERQAIALYNRAVKRVNEDPKCRPAPPSATFTHDPPSAALLATIGILRRPATPEDLAAAQNLGTTLPAHGIYQDYVRVAHAANGREYELIAAQDAVPFTPQPLSCLRRLHTILLHLARGRSARVRHRALSFYADTVRARRRLLKRGPQEGVFLFEHRQSGEAGGGGGGASARYIAAHGLFGSSGEGRRRATVSGLLPDGVASVTSIFPRKIYHGAHRPLRVYPHVIRRTDPVNDNVVSFVVERDAEDAFATKMIWRAADGSIVRTVNEPR